MVPVTGLDCRLHKMQTYGAAAVETGGWQMSTGHLHLSGFESHFH